MRRAGIAAGSLAIPYLPFLVEVDPGEGLVGALCVGIAALIAPGAVGAAGGGPGVARRFVRGLLTAATLNVAAAVLLRLAGTPPTPRSFAWVLGVLVVTSGAVVFGCGGALPDPRRHRVATAMAAVGFLLAFVAGTRIVPPLEDQDTEVQGTAWGLAHDLEPLCLTNRSTIYFFAHPLLLHAFNASTLTLSGDLETVRTAYDAAFAERERLSPELRARGPGAALAALRDPAERPDRYGRWRREVYRPFLEDPALFGTRAPNFVFAAAVALLVFALARRLGAGPLDAALATIAYATLPEILVRSGYGGYYALTAATLLAGARLAAGEAGGGRAGAVAGVLAVLTNQKALVLAAAVAVARGLSAVASRSVSGCRNAMPLLGGIVAGGALFWVYGLGLAPHEFVADHLLEHGFRRFAGQEVLNRAGQAMYPSRPGLWLEFAGHLGWLWTGIGAVALATGAWRVWTGLRDRAAGAPPAEPTLRLTTHLVLWVLVGAVLFTVTDWRQTKHLCLLVPALSVLVGRLAGAAPRPAGFAIRAALVVTVAWNLIRIGQLTRDFESFPISSVW